MSVLIKDMQMPKNCSECPLSLSGKYCRIHKTYTTFIKIPARPAYCPIVGLPEHHGRLIDADEMKNLWAGCSISGSISPLLDARPTVVEAE